MCDVSSIRPLRRLALISLLPLGAAGCGDEFHASPGPSERAGADSLSPDVLLSDTPSPDDPIGAPGETPTVVEDPPAPVQNPDTEQHDDPMDLLWDTSWFDGKEVSEGQSMLRVLLTDAPVEAESVFVTLCGVQVEALADDAPTGEQETGFLDAGDSDSEQLPLVGGASSFESKPPDSAGWYDVSTECETIDLLELRDGVTEAIGVAALPAGNYGQIRLLLVDSAIIVDGKAHGLSIPSAAQSGVKVVGGFQLREGRPTTLVIDFDAGQSVHHSPGQGYSMNPVVQLIGELH